MSKRSLGFPQRAKERLRRMRVKFLTRINPFHMTTKQFAYMTDEEVKRHVDMIKKSGGR